MVGEPVELPLRYQKETVGRLIVSPRAPGEKFTTKEQQLLADIAAQTGPVASATRLTLALQHSREKLVFIKLRSGPKHSRDLAPWKAALQVAAIVTKAAVPVDSWSCQTQSHYSGDAVRWSFVSAPAG